MPDRKYGRVFTDSDIEKIFEWLWQTHGLSTDLLPENVISAMDDNGVRFKFPIDEPIFILRGRDKRALGTVRHYLDHQSPRAPQNHLDGIEAAVTQFERYRINHSEDMKEPD